jgi:flagellar hook-basal body complex protein FliE
MNPISSIRQMIPTLGPMPLPPGVNLISPAELEKLASSGEIPKMPGIQGASPSSFAGALEKMVNEVNQKQVAAGQAVHDLQSGQNVSLHQTMIAMEEASVSFQLMVEVRNKVLESYQELMRMQV